MRNALIAFVAITAIGAALYTVLHFFIGIDSGLAGGLAFAPMALHPTITEKLNVGTTRTSRPTPLRRLVPLEGPTLPWFQVVLYGAMFYIGTMKVLGIVMQAVAGDMIVDNFSAYSRLSDVAFLVVGVPLAYLFGIWVAERCAKYHIFAVVAMLFLGALVSHVISFLTGWINPGSILLGSIQSALILSPFGIIGLWRGRRHRVQT